MGHYATVAAKHIAVYNDTAKAKNAPTTDKENRRPTPPSASQCCSLDNPTLRPALGEGVDQPWDSSLPNKILQEHTNKMTKDRPKKTIKRNKK